MPLREYTQSGITRHCFRLNRVPPTAQAWDERRREEGGRNRLTS
jgi:hypothetical protein